MKWLDVLLGRSLPKRERFWAELKYDATSTASAYTVWVMDRKQDGGAIDFNYFTSEEEALAWTEKVLANYRGIVAREGGLSWKRKIT